MAVAKQKPAFTFSTIQNISQTNGRNVKQPKAQKINKKIAKSSPMTETNSEQVLIAKKEWQD